MAPDSSRHMGFSVVTLQQAQATTLFKATGGQRDARAVGLVLASSCTVNACGCLGHHRLPVSVLPVSVQRLWVVLIAPEAQRYFVLLCSVVTLLAWLSRAGQLTGK